MKRTFIALLSLLSLFSFSASATENPFSNVVGNYVVTGCRSHTVQGASSAFCLFQMKAFCVRVSEDGNTLSIREGYNSADGYDRITDPLFVSTVREYKSESGSFASLENGASFTDKPGHFMSSLAIIKERGHLIHRDEIYEIYTSGTPQSVISHTVRDYSMKPAPASLANRFKEICGN